MPNLLLYPIDLSAPVTRSCGVEARSCISLFNRSSDRVRRLQSPNQNGSTRAPSWPESYSGCCSMFPTNLCPLTCTWLFVRALSSALTQRTGCCICGRGSNRNAAAPVTEEFPGAAPHPLRVRPSSGPQPFPRRLPSRAHERRPFLRHCGDPRAHLSRCVP